MKAEDQIDNFIRTWKAEKNTNKAVYSSYHYDAMVAFAEHFASLKINSDKELFCTGCGRSSKNPLGVNKNGEKFLACCPDSNYSAPVSPSDEEISEVFSKFLLDYRSLSTPSHIYYPEAINSIRSLFTEERKQK